MNERGQYGNRALIGAPTEPRLFTYDLPSDVKLLIKSKRAPLLGVVQAANGSWLTDPLADWSAAERWWSNVNKLARAEFIYAAIFDTSLTLPEGDLVPTREIRTGTKQLRPREYHLFGPMLIGSLVGITFMKERPLIGWLLGGLTGTLTGVALTRLDG